MKKVLSVFLSIIMLLSITVGLDIFAYAETNTYSGSCGVGVHYNLNITTGNLNISGTGRMQDYISESVPWSSNSSKIKTITIEDGVSSIGCYAFQFCTKLSRITIPNSVTSIGEYAIRSCINLSSITIPTSVTSIGAGAFSGCTGLTNIAIPTSVMSIGDGAFSDCIKLTSVTIPGSVTSTGDTTFYNCTGLQSVTIEYGVTSIGDNSFYGCEELKSVIVPNSVTNIGKGAFNYCYWLESIILPNSITSIGEGAFACSGLEYITIPNGVTSIDNYTFSQCSDLIGITIPNSVTNIGKCVVLDCNRLSDIYYEGTIDEWKKVDIYTPKSTDDQTTVHGNDSLFSATIHCLDAVINCKHSNYNGKVTKEATCTTTGVMTYLCTVCGETKTEIIPKITHTYNTGKVTKEATCTTTGVMTYLCTACGDTKTEIIPKITHTYNTGEVIKAATCTETGTKTYTCVECGKTKTEEISATGHKAVTDKAVAATCTTAGKTAGSHCSVCNTIITAQKTVPATGHSYNNDGKCTICGNLEFEYTILTDETAEITGYSGTSSRIIIPSIIDGYKVTSIGDSSFKNCFRLTSITIPNSVTSIGDYAFYGCQSLTSITIPNSVTNIGDSAFYHTAYYNNKSNWTNGVLYIGNYLIKADAETVSGAYSIKSATTAIADKAFAICLSITSVTIPNSVISIGDYAFHDCINLTSITIPNSVTSIGEGAFSECINLTSATILNKDCNILSGSEDYPTFNQKTVIYGYKNSTAEAYAKENDIEFMVLECSHTWNSGTVTKAATCTANGVKTYTCTKCKATKTEAIKATGHKAVTDKAVAATCTTAGKTAGSHCSVCNTIITAQKTVPATGHSYDAGKVTKQSTATTAGVKTYTCTKCKATKTETISALGLKAPTLKVTVNANGTFTLSWNKVSGAEKYELYIKQADGSYKLMKTTTATSFTTAIAAYGKQFTYKMCAVAGSAKSAYSAAVNATNNKKLATPTLKATVNANGTFKLSWSAVIGATAYELYIKQADGSYKLMKTTTATSFTTAYATYGKQFSYKMRAVNSKNKSIASAYSAVVNAKNTKKLQTPTLKVTVNANGTFKLSWNKVTGADKYELYIKQSNGSYKLMKTTSATSFTTAYATYGKQFSYKMRAVNSKNKSIASAYSAVVNAKNTKKLQTPTLKAAVNKNGSFKLSWGKVTGATSYQIYMKQSNGTYKLIKTTSSTSFTTAVAAKGKTYSYKVRAVTSKNKNATSAYSKVVSAKRK